MNARDLDPVAQALVAPGKGLLAADESGATIGKRFASIGTFSTEATRRDYRELLFTTPGLNEFISGVILFDETLRQTTTDGTRLIDLILTAGMIPGIKVDKGTKPLVGFPGDLITEGLDGLRERLTEYRQLGARFTKWRAVIAVGTNNVPSLTALKDNAAALARFAAESQLAGLVPIVEPEVLMDGSHSIERHAEITGLTLQLVFQALAEHRVRLEAMLLKPNMILPGTDHPRSATIAEVADATLRCLRRHVPAAVPGIVFLSGGQSEVRATEHLNAMNKIDSTPWQLSFSYGRALQAPVLARWRGKPENVSAAQAVLLHRARCNALARSGKYSSDKEKSVPIAAPLRPTHSSSRP
ncbi:MAG: class I fructose-bisphosphate aldolase [Opitutus sp.]